MPKKRHTAEEIIRHLRTVEIEQVKGTSLDEATRKIGVIPTTLARWKAEFGGLRVDQAKQLKELEQKNSRLRKIVSDQFLEILILKEAVSLQKQDTLRPLETRGGPVLVYFGPKRTNPESVFLDTVVPPVGAENLTDGRTAF